MSNTMKRFSGFVSAALVFFCAAAADAAIYNAQQEFSSVNNPNLVWSSGYAADLSSGMTFFTTKGTNATLNYIGWNAGTSDAIPAFFQSLPGGSPLLNVGQGEIALHGGSQGLAILRFTAPASGLYNLVASWKEGHTGAVDVFVRHNSTILSQSLNTLLGGSYSGSGLNLAANDTIDIVVGLGLDGVQADSTPVNMIVSNGAVPEPASLVVWGVAGVVGVYAVRKRRVLPGSRLPV